ncbi:extracellular solute-binding protein [Natronospora cellulosivora (SeqCode)]
MGRDSLDLLLVRGSLGNNILENFMREKLQEFEDSENINVNITLISWNRAYERIISAFKSYNSPDLLLLGTSWVQSLAYQGYLLPINEYNNEKNILTAWFEECCFFQGNRVAVPWVVEPMIMVAREDILDKLGVNKAELSTWEGFLKLYIEIVERRKKDPSFPKAMSFFIRQDLGALHSFMSWCFASGFQFPDLKSDKILASSEVIEVFKYLHKLIISSDIKFEDVDKHPYKINEDFYKHGSYVFYVGHWYGMTSQLLGINENINENYTYLPLKIPSKNLKKGTHGGGSVLCISSRTKHPLKARSLLEFLLEEGFVEGWMHHTANLPAFETHFWKQRYNNEGIRNLYKLAVNSNNLPYHPCWSSIENILIEGVSHCMWTLFNASEKIEREIKPILSKIDQDIHEILKMSWEMNC